VERAVPIAANGGRPGLSDAERRELEEVVRVFELIVATDPSNHGAQEALRDARARLHGVPKRDEAPLMPPEGAPTLRSPAARPRGRFPLLGELMVSEGLVSREQLAHVLAEQKRTGDKLGQILVRLELISEEQLIVFLSKQYQVRALSALAQLTIDPAVLALVPAALARKHDVLPIQRERTRLTVAMADATDVSALDDIAFITNLEIEPVLAPRGAIRQAIEQHYDGTSVVSTISEASAEDVEVLDESDAAFRTADVFELKESADEAPIVKLVNSILVDAIDAGASDIHWEPYESQFRVRLRVDGILHERWSPPRRLEPAVLSRLKIMSGLDIAERRVPQDGRIRLRHRHREIDLRVSVLPTSFGEKCVIRILDKEAVRLDLTGLGFDAWGLDVFQKAIRQPYGMILITGPTGSGKTTTLYAAIHTINSPETNIVTVEDPVEYNLRGVNQVQVNDGIGRTFAVALRSFLRQDPDVILVGETRDLETAQISIRAALTGHLVFSTLHTNDCPSSVTRLVDMGIPSYLVASSLILIVAQRLARKICAQCREPYEVGEDSLVGYGHVPIGQGKVTIYRRRGCVACGNTGMKGRVALYEVMPVTPELRDLIAGNASITELRALAQSQKMKTLREAGLARVLDGTTTVDELLRVTLA
jgi:type IV pilus assembly protein PilB